MRDRFNQRELWTNLGIPIGEVMDEVFNAPTNKAFRARLFTRIVPVLKDIGLFGPKMQRALADMGVIEYAKADVAAILADDNRVAEDFDRQRFVQGKIDDVSSVNR